VARSSIEHNVDALGLYVALEFLNGFFTLHTAILEAAPRHAEKVSAAAVDPDIPRTDAASHMQRIVYIVCQNRGRQAEFSVVCQLDPSSVVRQRLTARIGPKTSSRHRRMLCVTSA
jgi:hypothetical protein